MKIIESVFAIPLIRAKDYAEQLSLSKKGQKIYNNLPDYLKHVEGGVSYLNFVSVRHFLRMAADEYPSRANALRSELRSILDKIQPIVEGQYDINIVHMTDEDGELVPVVHLDHLQLISADIHPKVFTRGLRWVKLEDAAASVSEYDPVFADFLIAVSGVHTTRKYRSLVNEYRTKAEQVRRYADRLVELTLRKNDPTRKQIHSAAKSHLHSSSLH